MLTSCSSLKIESTPEYAFTSWHASETQTNSKLNSNVDSERGAPIWPALIFATGVEVGVEDFVAAASEASDNYVCRTVHEQPSGHITEEDAVFHDEAHSTTQRVAVTAALLHSVRVQVHAADKRTGSKEDIDPNGDTVTQCKITECAEK